MNRKSHQILQVNVIEYSTISNAIALMRMPSFIGAIS